jgi:hypothetical protein
MGWPYTEEWVLGEVSHRPIIQQLLVKFLLSRKNSLKRSPTTFKSMKRVRMECPVIAAESWVNVLNRNRERCRAITRAPVMVISVMNSSLSFQNVCLCARAKHRQV